DPIFRAAYPADLLERNEIVAGFVRDGDLDAIAAPVDFLGVNNYFRFVVSAGADGPQIVRDPEAEQTDMGWEVYPDGLHRLLVRVAEDYAPPAIYVTENGAAFSDVRVHDGAVHDPERTTYLETYIDAMSRAVDDGAPVKGYFVWSLLDNFEWARGYPQLVNAWGLAASATGAWWVANEARGSSTIYAGDGSRQRRVIDVPGGPTGVAWNGGHGFLVRGVPARVLYACEDGRIRAWAPGS